MNNTDLIEITKGYTIPVLDKGYVRFIDKMGTDMDILEAARVSYKSPSKGLEQDTKLLNYLYKKKHSSPFEMVKIKFNIKMPIFIARQYVRHRMQNLNEMSGRYTELPNEFYIPTKWRKQDTKNKQGSILNQDFDVNGGILPYKDGLLDKDGYPGVMLTGTLNKTFTESLERRCKEAYSTYEMLMNAGVAREMARMVLPLNIYTEFYCCWDLKNLMNFIQLREESDAQQEIREYAAVIKTITKHFFPITIAAFDKYKWKLID